MLGGTRSKGPLMYRSLSLFACASTIAATAVAQPAAKPARPTTPSEVVAAAPASAWRTISPDDLLVIDLKNGGRVVVQLAPAFAPVHVANIQIGRASGRER